MKIFLTGANGFIGLRLLMGLLADGHEVVAAVRQASAFRRRFPTIPTVAIDMNQDILPEVWAQRLTGVDCVINCAGALQSRHGQNLEAIHTRAPIALFEAAEKLGIRRIIQISAISADANTAYASTKRDADAYLERRSGLEWVIIRPSLVVDRAAYGGTALLRAFAVMPLMLPVMQGGRQLFDPITMDDLVKTVQTLLQNPRLSRMILAPVGPVRLTTGQILSFYRTWLGLRAAPLISMPQPLVRLAGKLGDWFGDGALTTTSIQQIEHGNCGDVAAFATAIGFQPQDPLRWLQHHPADPADVWQAYLLLLKPLVRVVLIGLWALSGGLGLLALESPLAHTVLSALHLPIAAGALTCVWDFALALLLLFNIRPSFVAGLQAMTVAAYTLLLGSLVPALWLDPLGPLLKNIPILALIAVHGLTGRVRA